MINSVYLKQSVLYLLDLNEVDNEAVTYFQVYENLTRAQTNILKTFPFEMIDDALQNILLDVTINVPRYQWQTDHIRFKSLFVDYASAITDTNPGKEVRLLSSEKFIFESLDNLPSKKRPLIITGKNGFEMRPIPDATVSDGFNLRYIQQLPTLTKDQNCLLKSHLEEALLSKATSLCALIDGYNPELSKIHADKYERLKLEALA